VGPKLMVGELRVGSPKSGESLRPGSGKVVFGSDELPIGADIRGYP